MAEEKKDSKQKVLIIVLIVVIVVILAAGAVVAVLLLQNNKGGESTVNEPGKTSAAATSSGEKNPLILDYDNSAVALTPEDLNKKIDEMQQKVSEGEISLEYQNVAFSDNGTDFTCHLANSDMNTEDMFIAVYTDATYTEQIYLSGLLTPGTVIENFRSEIKLSPGEHECVAVFTTVTNDHKTMTGQISVVIKLSVG